jgi:hypothetical protein
MDLGTPELKQVYEGKCKKKNTNDVSGGKAMTPEQTIALALDTE